MSGGETWGKGELLRRGGGKPDRSNRVDRFLGRMVRLVFKGIWGVLKMVFKGLWRLVRPSPRDRSTTPPG